MFTSTTTDYHKHGFSHHHHPDTTAMAPHTNHEQADHERSSNVTTMQPHIRVRLLHYAKSAGAATQSGAWKNGWERWASTEVSIALRPRSTAISLGLERAKVRPSLGRRSQSSFVSVWFTLLTFAVYVLLAPPQEAHTVRVSKNIGQKNM